jgi:signal transduction histidine kinase
LIVVDNGKGMSSDELNSDSRGLRYMQQRADLLGATLHWSECENGKGTKVEVRLKMEGAESQSTG